MRKFSYIILISSFFFKVQAFSQVTIGSGVKPDENALLDLKTEIDGSSNKGILLPRMALQALNKPQPITDANLIDGMIVYNTNNLVGENGAYYWKDQQWNIMSAGPWNISNTSQKATSNAADIYQMGKVGVGVALPTAQLHIKAAIGNSPVKIEGLSQGAYKNNSLLSLTSDGTMQKIDASELENAIANQGSIPVPNIYTLSKTISGFLNSMSAGNSQSLAGLIETKAAIKGMTFDSRLSNIYFPPGVYQITFVYEALNTSGCTLSSYFVDFPTTTASGAIGSTRIHSTASHNSGSLSNHGGAIIYTTVLKTGVTWKVRLGRGQSGNCNTTGMEIIGLSTQVSIFRLGDAT